MTESKDISIEFPYECQRPGCTGRLMLEGECSRHPIEDMNRELLRSTKTREAFLAYGSLNERRDDNMIFKMPENIVIDHCLVPYKPLEYSDLECETINGRNIYFKREITPDGREIKLTFENPLIKILKMTEPQILASRYPVRQHAEAIVCNEFVGMVNRDLVSSLERQIREEFTLDMSFDSFPKSMKQVTSGKVILIHENTLYDLFQRPHNYQEIKTYLDTAKEVRVTNDGDVMPEKVLYVLEPEFGHFYQLGDIVFRSRFKDGIVSTFVECFENRHLFKNICRKIILV